MNKAQLLAQKREIVSKKQYWENQLRLAKKYIRTYDKRIDLLTWQIEKKGK